MECLQNLVTIPNGYDRQYIDLAILPGKFPFTNTRIPYVRRYRYASDSWESRITQKRFAELFNYYGSPLRNISIVDNKKKLQRYVIGAGFVFRKLGDYGKIEKMPIILRCNEGIFVDKSINEFETKLLKKISTEFTIKDFIMENLIVHHKFRFSSLKERSEYLNMIISKLREPMHDLP